MEDDSPSRKGLERPIDSSPSQPENNSVPAAEEVTLMDPIVYVDPMGVWWSLPFERVKTWEVRLSLAGQGSLLLTLKRA